MSSDRDGCVGPRKPVFCRRCLSAALVLLLSIVLTLVAFFSARDRVQRETLEFLERGVFDRAKAVQDGVDDIRPALTLLQGCLAANRTIDRGQFATMAQPLLANFSGVYSLQWVPRVAAAERPSYEAAARRDGLADFCFWEKDRAGRRVPAPPRDEHYPVFFRAPAEGAEHWVGFDETSDAARWASASRARDTGQLTITDLLPVVCGPKDIRCYVAFLPVYRSGASPRTVVERRRGLAGFMVAVVQPKDLVDRVLGRLQAVGFDTWLFDDTLPGNRRLVYAHLSRTRPDRDARMKTVRADDLPALNREAHYDLGGRHWSIACSMSPSCVARRESSEPWVILGTGCAVTLLLGAYFVRNAAELTRRQDNEQYLRDLLDAIGTGVIVVDAETHEIVDANARALGMIGGAREAVVGRVCHQFICQALCGRCPITDLGQTVDLAERVLLTVDSRKVPVLKTVVSVRRGGRRCLIESFIDVTERKQAETKLAALTDQLMDASRQAGMAELATGVLHNVGNVLNSVNVSTTLLTEKVRKSKVGRLAEVSEMLQSHAAELGTYFADDEKGRRVPGYLVKLAGHLADEQAAELNELVDLAKNVEHIKKIISTQQANARALGVVEEVSLADMANDALTVTSGSFERYGIHLVREYAAVPPVMIDKHRLLQILVNLVRNAKHALLDGGSPTKRLTVRIAAVDADRVRIEVLDNGVGIPAENLTRIFSHGFTTKKDGHGFGLHSSALTAQDLGGALTAASDGPGRGATFTLILPVRPAEAASGAPLTMPAIAPLTGVTL